MSVCLCVVCHFVMHAGSHVRCVLHRVVMSSPGACPLLMMEVRDAWHACAAGVWHIGWSDVVSEVVARCTCTVLKEVVAASVMRSHGNSAAALARPSPRRAS